MSIREAPDEGSQAGRGRQAEASACTVSPGQPDAPALHFRGAEGDTALVPFTWGRMTACGQRRTGAKRQQMKE